MDEEVKVHEGSLSLPTYAIKGENRNPVFRSQYGVAHIYPYTLLDDIDAECHEKTYKTLVLENQYLRVTIITDLGGRVYSVFDKISQREVFYKNSIVRFAPLAIRGAFFSGGLEFSFPVAHAPTTCDKVNWDHRVNKDGSASVSIGGLEHISGLRWMITLTLFPDRCALAQDVYLHNPGSIPGRYHYWTNASLDANEGTEFIYPLHRARSYEYAGSASWPFARLDLIQDDPGLPGMEGVPMWPARQLQKPVNFRWQKNMLAQVSIFGRDVKWDYFGAWQHKTNHGYAHVANKQDVSGMKLWSWGNAPVGIVNQTSLTDDGSVYAETQCGAMETQLNFDFLKAGDTRTWREWWIPLRELDGLTCASEHIGAKITLIPIPESDLIRLKVALCPAKSYNDALVNISVAEKVLMAETIKISPQKPWLHEITIKAAEIADKPLTLTVRDSLGNVILENTQNRDTDPIDDYHAKKEELSSNADDYYKLGFKEENFDNREQAKEAYRKALSLDNTHQDAHLHYGLMLLRSAQLEEADKHFSRAYELGKGESTYYRGLIAMIDGRLPDAEAYFKKDDLPESYAAASLIGLGKVALKKKEWNQAIEFFSMASIQASHSVTPLTLLAIAYRYSGNSEGSHSILLKVLDRDPLNHMALFELAKGKYAESEVVQQKLDRILADDTQYYTDLACHYMDACLNEDALEVLKAAWSIKEDAMTAYLCAFLYSQSGNTPEAGSWLGKAGNSSPEYGFPSRLPEVFALQYAIQIDKSDAKARYYLGNFYYAHERYEEAVQLWTEALDGLSNFDVLLRNLGIAAWQRKNDLLNAITWLEKALAVNPQNQDIYLHLDELYKATGQTGSREDLLKRISSLTIVREDVHKHRITMMVELGHYQQAIEVMTSEKFIPLEMDQSFHEIYVKALMMRAQDHINAGHYDQAIQDFSKMLEYPENHGVGAPTTRAQAHIYYHLGLAYEKQGKYQLAIKAWLEAASEQHPHGNDLYKYVQMALDKVSRYSELGLEE